MYSCGYDVPSRQTCRRWLTDHIRGHSVRLRGHSRLYRYTRHLQEEQEQTYRQDIEGVLEDGQKGGCGDRQDVRCGLYKLWHDELEQIQ